MARLRFVTTSLLGEFLFTTRPVGDDSRAVMTRRIQRSLVRRGLVAKSQRTLTDTRQTTTPVYYLTPAGDRRAAALGGMRRPRLRSSGSLLVAHSLAVAELLLAFARAARQHVDEDLVTWECDWEIAPPFGRAGVVPDGYLLYRIGDRRLHVLVEVDTGSERNRVIAEKVRRYLELERVGTWRGSFPVWPYVLFVATTPARAAHLRRVAELVCIDHSGRWVPGARAFHFAASRDVQAEPLGAIWRTVSSVDAVSLLSASARVEAR